MPLIRRIPTRGFNNTDFAMCYAPVNLDSLDVFPDGSKVDEAVLRARGLVKGRWDGVKLLGGGKLKPKNLTLEVHAASGSAKAALEAAGGKLTLLKS
jgi:large subunit ribosomal protein L15